MIYLLLRKFLPEELFHKPLRIDHSRSYLAVTLGLWLMSISLIVIGAAPQSSIDKLNSSTHQLMAGIIFLGTTAQIHGSLCGTRYFFPDRDIRDCYYQALWAILPVNVALLVYVWTLFDKYGPMAFSVFGASVGLSIILGNLWSTWDFKIEIERLNSLVIEESDDV